MNVVINAVLSYTKPRGVGRYINNLIASLARIDKDNQYYIFYGEWMKNYAFLTINEPNFHFIPLKISRSTLIRNLYLAIILPIRCRVYSPDILFLIDTQAIMFKPCALLSTIHDLAEFSCIVKYSKLHALLRRQIVRHQIRMSDRLLTVSNYTKKDICSKLGINEDRIDVIYNSVQVEDTINYNSFDDYFLVVSEIDKSKNLSSLIRAYALLPKEIKCKHMLYVVGNKGNDYSNVVKIIEHNKLNESVRIFGFVTDKQLNQLYERAYCFIYPSYFEGFGLPVLEAMAKGLPVLCSNCTSLPEVGGDAVMTFDPYSIEDICCKISKVTESPQLRSNMASKSVSRASFFSRDKSAYLTMATFSKMYEDNLKK